MSSGKGAVGRIYYDDDKRYHRIDGPAIVDFVTGKNEWWYHGEKINVSSQEEFERFLKLKPFW